MRTRAMTQKMNLKEMALIGVLGGLAAVLMMFRFPLPFMPPYMSFDLSGVLEIIGGFTLGPVAAVFIILVKILVQVVTTGSQSMMTGELQNFLLSAAYVLPAVQMCIRDSRKAGGILGAAFSDTYGDSSLYKPQRLHRKHYQGA